MSMRTDCVVSILHDIVCKEGHRLVTKVLV
jgi:hypothetical protein